MAGAARRRARQFIDVLPLLVLLVATVAYAWQLATVHTPHPRLVQLVAIGAVFELGGAFIDVALAEQLAERRLFRVFGWIAPMAVVGFFTFAFASQTHFTDPTVLLIAAAFLVPRFVTFVLHPPRDEYGRRRIKALARDRFDAVWATVTTLPVFIVIGIVIVAPRATPPPWLVSGMLSPFVLWILFALASTWHMGSGSFSRHPQRLFTREPWPRILRILAKRRGEDASREEEAAWLADPEAGAENR